MRTYVLTEDQDMVKGLARELTDAEIRPRSEEIDHEGRYAEEAVAVMAEAGMIGCAVPEEMGGAGLDHLSQTIAIEETAKACASTAWTIASSVEVIEMLVKYGNEKQQEVIPEIMGGSLAAAAGSDAVYGAPERISLKAEKTADGYVLNGCKKNVQNAADCAWFLAAAEEENEKVWFLIDRNTAGLSIETGPARLGMKGCAVADVCFSTCEVPEDCKIAGDLTAELAAAQSLYMAAIASGIAQGAAEEAVTYINQRVQFKKTIAQFENTQQVMAEILAKNEAARALVWAAAQVKDVGEDYAFAAALAKTAASDTAASGTRKCLQFMGGYGYSREYPMERKMRDAKMTELLGGASHQLKEYAALQAVVTA